MAGQQKKILGKKLIERISIKKGQIWE